MRVWNYGDSHAAGQELGSAYDCGKSWIQENLGFENRTEAVETLGTSKYRVIVKDKWYNYLRDNKKCSTTINGAPCSPEMSYAGAIARHYDVELITRAEPGASNDYSVGKMISDKKHWAVDDIIMICFVIK